MKKYIIPYFVPHIGCPVGCVFCNQNEITGVESEIEPLNVVVDRYLSYFKERENIELAFYGGSFTAINENLRLKLLREGKELIDRGLISSIRISTRPDAIDKNILQELKDHGVKVIELGVQSLDPEVLKLSNRGHNTRCVYESCGLIKDYGFTLGLQQMLGLPGDTLEKSIYTAREFVKLSPEIVRIYPTLVVKNTKLEQMYRDKTYMPLALQEGVSWAKEVLKIYNENGINVIRVGLQPTDNINYGGDLVAGPFHAAFRQLVEESILLDYFTSIGKLNDESIEIAANGKNISYIVGLKGKNKEKLKEILSVKNIKFKIEDLPEDIIYIRGEKETKFIKCI